MTDALAGQMKDLQIRRTAVLGTAPSAWSPVVGLNIALAQIMGIYLQRENQKELCTTKCTFFSP